MKLEIEFKESEYEITLNNQKVFKGKNHRRILREVRNIMDKHDDLIKRKRLR